MGCQRLQEGWLSFLCQSPRGQGAGPHGKPPISTLIKRHAFRCFLITILGRNCRIGQHGEKLINLIENTSDQSNNSNYHLCSTTQWPPRLLHNQPHKQSATRSSLVFSLLTNLHLSAQTLTCNPTEIFTSSGIFGGYYGTIYVAATSTVKYDCTNIASPSGSQLGEW